VEEMAQVMQARFAVESEDPKWSSLVTLRKGDENVTPMFFFHTAPGDVLMYANLIHHLKSDQPCYGFQSLGLNDVNHVHGSIEEMAAHYVGLLTEFYPSGPYLLAGWCYGGSVAMEAATQLREQGREVALVALFDVWAHKPADPELRKQYQREQKRILRTLGFKGIVRFTLKRLWSWLKISQNGDVQEQLVVKVTHGVLKNREAVYQQNVKATLKYQSRYYSGNIKLFEPDLMNLEFLPDFSMGWHLLVDGYEIFLIPGDHRGLMHEPNVQHLARALQQCIDAIG